jgi:LysR family glycine cleavage system transcriptional activator
MFNQRKPDCALTIACSFSFSLLWLAPRLNQFLATHPSLDIRIISTLWPDDYLLSEADIEIRFGSQELVGERATLLVSDVIVPVCSPAMADSLTSWTEICQQPLIQTAGMSDTWQCWADALGLEPPPPVSISVDTSALALEIVRNSSSVALVNRLLAHQLILSNKLAMPLCSSTKAKDNYFVKVRGNTSQDSIAHNFVDWLMLEASKEATL